MWTFERGDVLVRQAHEADELAIRDRLRKSDVEEIWAATRMTPREALAYSREGSPLCLTVQYKSMAVAMFGTAPMPKVPDAAGVWFVATDDLTAMQLSFLRMSRRCVARMLDDYPLLFNWVDARNVESIAWLKWCGAKLDEAAPFGPDGLPFHLFRITRSNLCVQP